jgi:hypothetical protein
MFACPIVLSYTIVCYFFCVLFCFVCLVLSSIEWSLAKQNTLETIESILLAK